MENVAFFDTKQYDLKWFEAMKSDYGIDIKFLENKLNPDTSILASGCRAVVAFVSDDLSAPTIDKLSEIGVEAVAMRCAGFNNVDLRRAKDKLKIYRVPAYSPNAVAEHAMALLLCLNRKLHRAYNRVREYNFSLKGLEGFDLKGKTAGVVGTGKVGQAFIDICRGFGMNIVASDPYPTEIPGVEFVTFEQLCRQSDIISLHCPLTKESHHLINSGTLWLMKNGVYIINTSRGALIDSEALLAAIKSGKVAGAGLDVYEEESDFFYEDVSSSVIRDDKLKLLLSTPNVLVTSHQAFLTTEALHNIAQVTLQNLNDFFSGTPSNNEVTSKLVAQ